MLFLTLPLVGPVGSSYKMFHARGRNLLGPVLAHGSGTLPHQAEIWFITQA